MTIPLCQNCGNKIYKSYGQRGYLATRDHEYHYESFNTQEEFNAYSIPSNAYDINRDNSDNYFYIRYYTPQQSRDGLFHNRRCWEKWHFNHRDDIEKLIKTKGEWKA